MCAFVCVCVDTLMVVMGFLFLDMGEKRRRQGVRANKNNYNNDKNNNKIITSNKKTPMKRSEDSRLVHSHPRTVGERETEAGERRKYNEGDESKKKHSHTCRPGTTSKVRQVRLLYAVLLTWRQPAMADYSCTRPWFWSPVRGPQLHWQRYLLAVSRLGLLCVWCPRSGRC